MEAMNVDESGERSLDEQVRDVLFPHWSVGVRHARLHEILKAAGIPLSYRTFERVLARLGWRRHNTVMNDDDLQRISDAIDEIMPSAGAGYRSVRTELVQRLGADAYAPHAAVAYLRRTAEPVESALRFHNRIGKLRREVRDAAPNYTV